MKPDACIKLLGSAIGFALCLVTSNPPAVAAPFETTYTFSGGFNIYGYPPVPQVNGFDYYFTPVALNTSLLGTGATISSVEVSSFGHNNGDVINFDWEIFLGPSSFGLPEGQFTQTHVDPVSGYSRTAPTQVQFVIGSQADTQSYQFSGNYNFGTNAITATPYLALLKNASTSPMDLTDGLYAQLFFWTGDNRNVNIQFDDVTLTVRGDIQTPVSVPEPSSLLLLSIGVASSILVGVLKTNRI